MRYAQLLRTALGAMYDACSTRMIVTDGPRDEDLARLDRLRDCWINGGTLR